MPDRTEPDRDDVPTRRTTRWPVVAVILVVLAVGVSVVVAAPRTTAVIGHGAIVVPRRTVPAPDGLSVAVDAAPFGYASVRANKVRPIASLAKMMTAYLVLTRHPLSGGEPGPKLTITAQDVRDTDLRRQRGESLVPVQAGEVITERQALEALLLPSANNIAATLARWVAGTPSAFASRMTTAARSLGMASTHYTDPSGFEAATKSTAADQLRLVRAAMKNSVFATLVAEKSAVLPVAGRVRNTNTLLGTQGFVGVKTGSDDAAGGCLAFRAVHTVRGHRFTVTGVVLGAPGTDELQAGLDAGRAVAAALPSP